MTDVLKGDVTGPLSATRIPALRDSLDELIEVCTAMRDRLPEDPQEQPLTDAALRATPLPVQTVDDSYLLRIALKALARLTITSTGLRVDMQGGGVQIASLATAWGGVLPIGHGYNTQQGQGIQQSNIAFQTGFRRNLASS